MDIRNTTKYKITIDFESVKNKILGKKYDLSLLVCANKLAHKINKEFRNKNYIPNTLSFKYSENTGEIVLNVRQSAREAKSFGHSEKEHLLFLFIHSLLHLQGFTHGHKMEKQEKKFMEMFKGSI